MLKQNKQQASATRLRADTLSFFASSHSGLPPRTDTQPAADAAAPTPPPAISDEALGELSSLTLESYADQLKRARQVAGLASMLPKGMLGAAGAATDASVGATLKKQEDVIRCAGGSWPVCSYASDSQPRCCARSAMTADERAIPPAQLPAAARQRIAAAAGVTVGEVGDALAKFAWTAAAMKHMAQLKAEGKPMPTSFDNLEVRAHTMWMSVRCLVLTSLACACRAPWAAPGGSRRRRLHRRLPMVPRRRPPSSRQRRLPLSR